MRLFLLVLLCFFMAVEAKTETEHLSPELEIAIKTASRCLENGELHVVPDKLQFMQELSRNPSCEDSFHIVDVGLLVNRLREWKSRLPSVTPYYAVKTNYDPVILSVLAGLGMSFDCASQAEMAEILKLQVDASRIIFANPRKPLSCIRYAKKMGVNLLTFDSIEELDKLTAIYPEGKFVLRIKTIDSHSAVPLSTKFGATMEESREILDYAFATKVNVIGIAFHVGSNCVYLESYRQAIIDAAELFAYSKSKWGVDLSLLDLGGGWPGSEDEKFAAIALMVELLLKERFFPQVRVIAEPGRYFATKTTTVAARIIGKTVHHNGEEKNFCYYLANGVYGFFNSSLYYNHDLRLILSEGWEFQPLHTPKHPESLYPSLLWGPTCDAGDKIIDGIHLPEMQTGDFLFSENVGAYSYSLQTSFNQIPFSKPYYICECD